MRRYTIYDGSRMIYKRTREEFKNELPSNFHFVEVTDDTIENWCIDNGYRLEIDDPDSIIILEDPNNDSGPLVYSQEKDIKNSKKNFPMMIYHKQNSLDPKH